MRKSQSTIPSRRPLTESPRATNGFKENHGTEFLGCFEEVYEKDGTTYMDVYIHADCVGKGNLHTDFSRDM